MRPEKMVNLLLAEGISLHNIERENKSTITAVTETGNCMPLVELTELHGGEACVLEQRGLPVLLRSLKSRADCSIDYRLCSHVHIVAPSAAD